MSIERTSTAAAPAYGATTALYAATLAGSALLIFWVQPFFARALLPHAGGAAAVWLVALVFFQAALLAGYAYAHLLRLYLPLKGQAALHLLLLGIGAVWFLPPGLGEGFALDPAAPATGLIAALVVHLGLPFALLSATAPLLQHWFADSNHPQADNPYWLYAASNAGSLAALAAYPFLIEPALTLGAQGRLWTALYAAVFIGTGAAAIAAMRGAPAAPHAGVAAPRGTLRERLGWLVYAAMPTALLAAVTTHITTDIAAFPLLWVLPLGLYLATYIAAFAGWPVPLARLGLAAGPALALLVVSMWFSKTGFGWLLAANLAAFTTLAFVCHATLYARRPAPARLTEFYLMLALGGVCGTSAAVFLPPLIFSGPLEYPLLLAAACLLLPGRATAVLTSRAGAVKLARALGLLLAGIFIVAALPDPYGLSPVGLALLFAAIFATVATVFAAMSKFPALLALLLLGAWFAGPDSGDAGKTGSKVWGGRSFFGSYSVMADHTNRGFHFMSGTTAHGFERQDVTRERPEPATYYHARGPLGRMMTGIGARFGSIGVLGLGIGNMACHARPGQDWTFYEIDPLVAELARDRRFFHSLETCAPDARIVTGDGRLKVAAEPAARFDLLVMDAFSSNAVPVHLLTREAFDIYGRALAEGGVILVNVSNRHLDLAPVVARTAAEAGFLALEQNFNPEPARENEVLAYSSRWVALARDAGTLADVAATGPWVEVRGRARAPLWTDDHASLFGALY
ncbi:MAG: fused MFS/spermidine synthase [Parvibaculum sp.]|nr:fused MFS/spermidine synthase [Parvibaculum sp.]